MFSCRRLLPSPATDISLPFTSLRAAADIGDSHSRTPRNSKSARSLWNCPRVRAQSHATKRWLAVERPQVTRVERTGPVLFCAAGGCVTAHHSSDISRRGLLTKWRTARSSSIQKWRHKLTCIKSQKSSGIYTSMLNSLPNIHLHGYFSQADRCGDWKGPG